MGCADGRTARRRMERDQSSRAFSAMQNWEVCSPIVEEERPAPKTKGGTTTCGKQRGEKGEEEKKRKKEEEALQGAGGQH